jgi:hypothetical protein
MSVHLLVRQTHKIFGEDVHLSSLSHALHPLSWVTRLLVWTAPTRQVSEIPVTVTSRDSLTVEAMFHKVAAGLEVLRKFYPRGYGTVRRQIQRVVVGYSPDARAKWWDPPRVCMLSIEYFSQEAASATDVAFSLLHEATHGRLERLGFSYTPERRLRLETICTRAQMTLAENLPDHDSRVAVLNQTLEELDRSYSDANLQAGRVHALRELGAPPWLIRAVQWFRSGAA